MFFAGFAGEFAKQLQQSRADEADRAERSNALEASVLQHLATSPDPEIASHGITGLLDLADPTKANKRAGGLGGFLGKMAQHPALPTIRQLVSQGQQVNTPEHIPEAQVGGMPDQLPGEQMDGQGNPQTPAMPFTPAATPPPAFTPGDAYRPPTTQTVPRHVFNTPSEEAGLTARATTRGQLQGRVDVMRGTGGQSPLTPEEEDLLFPGKSLLTAGTVQGKLAPNGARDNSGRPLDPEGYYTTKADPRDPSKTVYFPSTPPASVANQAAISARPTFQHYVGPDGKTPGVWRVARDGSRPPEFVGYAATKGQYLQYVDPDTQEVSYIAAPAIYTPGAALAATSQPPASVGPPGAPQAGGPAAAPRGPAGAPAAAAAAPPQAAVAGGPPSSAPKGAIAGGRKRNLQPAEGAFIGPDGAPQVGRAFLDAGTGKYYSAQDPSQEAVGFIPGAEGAYATTAYAQANSTLVTIHAAMEALEKAGITQDNNPAHTADLMAKFYSGVTGGNPIDAAVSSLTNLAGLQGASQYVKSNSRSYQMFQQALQHLPITPSQRVAAMTQLPVVGGMVTPNTAMLAGSHGWDSFQSMYEKLKQAERIITEGKGALQELTGKTADRAIGAGGGAGGAAQAPPAPGGRGGAPGAASAQAVPPAVQQALHGAKPNRYTLTDGTVWIVTADGQIRPGG